MQCFYLGTDLWRVLRVSPSDDRLIDRTNTLTVATTDPTNKTVCISEDVVGSFYVRVLIHEISHCALVSFGLLDDLRVMVKPEYLVQAEEWICNFIADYGTQVFDAAYSIMGADALEYVPSSIERLIAS